MKKIYKIIILFCLLLIVVGLTIKSSFRKQVIEEIIEESSNYKVIYTEEGGYHYTIYNNEKEIVKEGNKVGSAPIITYIDDETIQILLSAGIDSFFCIYYDVVNDIFSNQYENPLVIKYGKVAFLDYNETPYKFIISNIFDEKYYKEFELDISLAVSPVIQAEFLDEYNLRVLYMSGETFEEKEDKFLYQNNFNDKSIEVIGTNQIEHN